MNKPFIRPLDEEEPNVRVMRIYELTVRFVVPDYGDPCEEHKHFPMATPLDYVTLDAEAVLLSYEEKEVVLP
jgi:hypothetical protein